MLSSISTYLWGAEVIDEIDAGDKRLRTKPADEDADWIMVEEANSKDSQLVLLIMFCLLESSYRNCWIKE